MLVTIIYHTDFRSEAYSLKSDILDEWSDANVNLMGVTSPINLAKYQIQLDGNVVYSGQNVTTNTAIINLIEERL